MLEKYNGKKVKLLVASNSGAGTGVANPTGGLTAVMSSVITVFGEITDQDDNFLELSKARTVSFDGFQTGYSSAMGSKDIVPSVLDNSTILVNKSSIITVSIVG